MAKTKQLPIESPFARLDRFGVREAMRERIRMAFASIASFYGFEKISVPPLEDARILSPLIKNGALGEVLPVVAKGLAFDAVLLPSAMLGVLRSYRAQKMYDLPQPVKLRFEMMGVWQARTQEEGISGRDEAGLVSVGEEGPIADAQIVQVIMRTLEEAGIPAPRTVISVAPVGCSQCFAHFRSSLSSYFRSRAAGLCRECKRQFRSEPMRVLICQEEKCAIAANHAPQVLDHLCDTCKKHLRGFLEFLDELKIPYYLDPTRFRPNSWYSKVIFEFLLLPPEEPGTEEAEKKSGSMPLVSKERMIIMAEGGRIGKTAELITGRKLDAVAGIIFLDEIARALIKESPGILELSRPDVFLAQLGELARRKSLGLIELLRQAGITVKESLGRDAIKSQLKGAEHAGAKLALIIGQKEALNQTIIIREVDSSIQETVPQEKLIDFLKRKLKK